MAAVSAEGSTVWVLIRRLNSSCSRSTAFVVRADLHWLGGRRVKVNSLSPASSRRQAGEGEQLVPGLLQAVGHSLALQPPLAQERLAPLGHLRRARGVDHVGVVRRDLLMQPVRGMGEEVPVLMNGAALSGHIGPE